MGNNKKIFRVLFFIVLFIPAYFAIYNISVITSDKMTVENTTKVTVTGQSAEGAVYTDPNDIKIFIATVEQATEITTPNRDLALEIPMLMTFFRGSTPVEYSMYLTLNSSDCVIKDKNNHLFLLREADAMRILGTPLSDSLYTRKRVPAAKITQANNSVDIYPDTFEWLLLKPSGNYVQSSIATETSSSNSIGISQGRPFEIYFAAEPDILNVEITDNKEVVYSGLYANLAEFTTDKDRTLIFKVTAEWIESDTRDYKGRAVYNISVDYDVPASFDISHSEAVPGDIIAVTAVNLSDPSKLTLTTDHAFTAKFDQIGYDCVALIPITYADAGKLISLTLTDGTNEPIIYQVQVADKAADKKNTGAQETIINANMSSSAQADKKKQYDTIFAQPSSVKLWNEPFIKPYAGATVFTYGMNVTINMGNPYTYEGVGIEIPVGAAVAASNTGIVVFAGSVPEIGQLVVVDHGMGVRTWYGHLSEISVTVGTTIARGQQVGLSGRTGMYSNFDPTLYFAASVGTKFADPLKLAETGIPVVDYAINPPESFDPDIPLPEDDIPSPEDADAPVA
ncbi:hypothetical protein FACS1894105_03330 [Clostridia bacterium]|nr:hypothetical protein FACS1894105_03330 [Clostridia bacterium]